LSALDFHHLSERTLPRGQSLTNYKRKYVEEEIEKCVLLCRNCHAEEHFPDLEIKDVDHKYMGIMEDRKCTNCGKDTIGNVFCSHSCGRDYYRKVKRPTKSELKVLIKNNSWTALGKQFGVSDNAVRKWAKSYGIL
jgi:hypothetical protein